MEDWDGSAEFLRSDRFGDVENETCCFPVMQDNIKQSPFKRDFLYKGFFSCNALIVLML